MLNKTVVVTVPRRGTRTLAREFVESRKSWLEKQWRILEAQRPPAAAFASRDGYPFPRQPRDAGVACRTSGSRRCNWLTNAFLSIPARQDIRLAVEKHLRRLAVIDLSRRVDELAAQHQCQVKRVVIRNQRTRWGSVMSWRHFARIGASFNSPRTSAITSSFTN